MITLAMSTCWAASYTAKVCIWIECISMCAYVCLSTCGCSGTYDFVWNSEKHCVCTFLLFLQSWVSLRYMGQTGCDECYGESLWITTLETSWVNRREVWVTGLMQCDDAFRICKMMTNKTNSLLTVCIITWLEINSRRKAHIYSCMD